MSCINLTEHAKQRCQQRGIRLADLDILLNHGTFVDSCKIFLRNRDAEEAIRWHKDRIRTLERLRGRTIVVRDGSVVTVF